MNNKMMLAIGIVAISCLCIAGLMENQGIDESSAATSTVNITYVVDSECGTAPSGNPDTYTEGSVVLEDAVANDGYKFAGWYVLNELKNRTFYSKITNLNECRGGSIVTIYAFWYYTVDAIYDLNGGSLEDTPVSITTDLITNISTPEYGDRIIYQWTYNLSVSDSKSTINNNLMTQSKNSGTVTYTVTWYYCVTYDVDDDVENPNSTQYRPGSTLTLKDASRYGYRFLGWYDESGNKVTSVKGGDCTLTAKWEELPKSSITYDVDGGILSDGAVEWYYVGSNTDLPTATRDGYYFNGWMIDGDRSKRIESITSDLEGDLNLVAWWIDINDVVGHGYVLNCDMTIVYQDFIPVHSSDTFTYRYYYYDPVKGFFVVKEQSDNSTNVYWDKGGESPNNYEYIGMNSIDINGTEYLCEVYELKTVTYVETQYIYDGWIPVKIDVRSINCHYTYTIAELINFDINRPLEVKGYGDAGIIVSGNGDYSLESEVTLVADVSSGTTFKGWYSESGTLLSTETAYTFTIYTDTVVYAYNTDDSDYSAEYGKEFTLIHPDGMTDITWTVYNSSSGTTAEYNGEVSIKITNGGNNIVYYQGTLNGATVYGFYTVVSDGYTVITYEWTYDGKDYSVTLDILYSDFLVYRNDGCSRQYSSTDATLKFVTSDDKYVVQIAKYIMTQTYGMSDTDRMNVLLAFVDYIEYKYDSESMGQDEYFKYPLETLYDQNGDCEDTSILFCAIASAMGYRSALLLFSGHMAASVEITDGSVTTAQAATFVRNGVTYYYCETTTTGWVVGKAPTGYTYKGQYYVYSDDQAIMPVASNYSLSDIDFEGSEAVIDKAGIDAADNAGNGLTVRSNDVSVDLSAETVAYLNSLGSDVLFSFSEADLTTLSEEQIAAIGEHAAYQFSMSYGDNTISDLNGTVTVYIRYDLRSGESGSSVKVYYVAEDGTLEEISASYSNGYVVFDTGHFSVYMVDATAEPTDYTFAVIAAVLAAVGVGLAVIIVVRFR